MSKINLLLPVGRLVQGSLYDANTTDAENRPLIYKTGPNTGQPRVNFYFAVAIAKGSETHWSQTEWGAQIFAVGQREFPNGQYTSPTFAWKITDGDSQIPNSKGRKPCEREGYRGHWVLNLSNGFAPTIVNADGTKHILEKDFVSLGDYVQVYLNADGNGSAQQPGVYLNPSIVAFSAYGDRIIVGPDPKDIGFGAASLPAGASLVPKGALASVPQVAALVASPSIPAPQPAAAPHYGILTPPAPTLPAAPPVTREMTAAAGGASYDQLIAAGWTDATLVQHGLMLP